MYQERPSTKRIVWTLAGLAAGLVALLLIIFAISYAIAPKTPPDTAPVSSESSASLVPTATPGVVPSDPVQASATVTTVAPSFVPTTAAPAVNPLANKVVVIDPGHQAKADLSLEPIGPGATDKQAKVAPGATGYKTHTAESAINLAVALKLRDILQARGARVIMVRTTQNVNIANSKRVKMANDVRADLFIRIHCDSSTDHSVSGISTLVPSASNSADDAIVIPSRNAGLIVQRAVVTATSAKDLGVLNRDDLSGFNWATVPSVLVEMGYLSNAKDEAKLVTAAYQQGLAIGLAKGVAQYLEQ